MTSREKFGRYMIEVVPLPDDPSRGIRRIASTVPASLHVTYPTPVDGDPTPRFSTLELNSREEVESFMLSIALAPDSDEKVQILRCGTFADRKGRPLSERDERLVRGKMLGLHTDVKPPRPNAGWIMDGFMEANRVLQLSGNSKAGKTLLVIDFIFALLYPGWRFLGKFEVGDYFKENHLNGIVLVNNETPPDVIDGLLDPLRLSWAESGEPVPLTVHHLRNQATAADVRQPERFDTWLTTLLDCDDCDDFGEDDPVYAPALVIVDNLTTILQALNQDVTANLGVLFREWSRLIEMADSSGILVTHTTADGAAAYGGTLSSAPSDGEIVLSRVGKGGSAKRSLRTDPRASRMPMLDGLRIVQRSEDRRLFIAGYESANPVIPEVADVWLRVLNVVEVGDVGVPEGSEERTEPSAERIEWVYANAPEEWTYRSKVCRSGAEFEHDMAALAVLIDSGRVQSRVPVESRPERVQVRRVTSGPGSHAGEVERDCCTNR